MTRFIDQDQTVTDRHTGLMWFKDASPGEFPMSWNEALDFMKTQNFPAQFGYSDWKMPNRRELFSLVSHDVINPSLIPGHPFVNVFPGYYWTSTTCARLPDQAWYVHLGGARVFKGMKYGSYMVWPVRVAEGIIENLRATGQKQCYGENGAIIDCRGTGQDGEFQTGANGIPARFIDGGSIIHDRFTGLKWLKDANYFGSMMGWDSASARIEELNRKCEFGYHDWRVPTIVELEGLLDLSEHSPALPAGHPFNNVQNYYWSSTTSQYDTDYAWALYTRDGILGVGNKPLPEFFLWPVRGSIDHSQG